MAELSSSDRDPPVCEAEKSYLLPLCRKCLWPGVVGHGERQPQRQAVTEVTVSRAHRGELEQRQGGAPDGPAKAFPERIPCPWAQNKAGGDGDMAEVAPGQPEPCLATQTPR